MSSIKLIRCGNQEFDAKAKQIHFTCRPEALRNQPSSTCKSPRFLNLYRLPSLSVAPQKKFRWTKSITRHQQFISPPKLYHIFVPPRFAPRSTLFFVVYDENYSYQFELHDKNRKLCLCLLPFIKHWRGSSERWQKSGGRRGATRRYVCDVPQMFYLWVSSTQLARSPASCRLKPDEKRTERTCRIKVLVFFRAGLHVISNAWANGRWKLIFSKTFNNASFPIISCSGSCQIQHKPSERAFHSLVIKVFIVQA